MTSSISERLHRLADRVSVDHPAEGRELWVRGRRYQRRRRSGVAVIAGSAAVLVVATGVLAWQRSAPPATPAPVGSPVGLPSRVHEPSSWLPGTEDAGALGQLVAVVPAERGGWTGSSRGWVGISATTGEYRFLDLPDQADLTEVSLAPDGRHLAYWSSGETTDTPNTNGEQQDVATGVAVYDPSSGEVVTHSIETEHGITPSFLGWVDDDTLLLDHTQDVGGDDDSQMDQSSGRSAPMLWWDLGGPARPLPAGDDADVHALGPSVGGRVVGVGVDEDLFVIGDGRQVRRQPSGGSLDSQVAPDPSGRRVAAVWAGNGRNPNQVAVARLPRDGGSLGPTLLPGSGRTYRVLGWTDDEHLAVLRRAAGGEYRTVVVEMDARTGAAATLVRLAAGSDGSAVDWATGLLGAPVVDRPAPPSPLDPRVTASLLTLTLTAAGVALVLWRRRVRP